MNCFQGTSKRRKFQQRHQTQLAQHQDVTFGRELHAMHRLIWAIGLRQQRFFGRQIPEMHHLKAGGVVNFGKKVTSGCTNMSQDHCSCINGI